MIYRGYDIIENENKKNFLIYFNSDYLGACSTIKDAQNEIDEELLNLKLKKERA
tara:strand:+ start:725 stop:886 length:162 start_codon:yes stop_codon:yes gene_type:complete